MASPGSNDIADLSNYYRFEAENVSSANSTYFTASGTATHMETTGSWIGVGDYEYGGTFYAGQRDLQISDARGWNGPYKVSHYVFEYRDAGDIRVLLGSEGAGTGSFQFITYSLQAKMNPSATLTFERAPGAAQTSFSIPTASGNFLRLKSGGYNFGTVSSGALDKLSSAAYMALSETASLSTYVRRISVGGDFSAGADTSWKIIVPEGALDASEPLLSVGGSFSVEGKIAFDFSNSDVSEGSYALISAAALDGFGLGDASGGFDVAGLDGKKWSLEWLSEGSANVLRMNVSAVPEPADFAAALGAAALALAARGRRRG